MTKLDLGGTTGRLTPKKITRFTVMVREKIYAGFLNSIPRRDGGLYGGQAELLQRKFGVNYTIPTLTSYTEKLGKKCTQ